MTKRMMILMLLAACHNKDNPPTHLSIQEALGNTTCLLMLSGYGEEIHVKIERRGDMGVYICNRKNLKCTNMEWGYMEYFYTKNRLFPEECI